MQPTIVVNSKLGYSHFSTYAMNTSLDMVLCHADEQLCQQLFNNTTDILQSVENTLSRYNQNAELYSVNQNAFQHLVAVSDLLWESIQDGIRYHKQTLGYFDVSKGMIYQALKDGKLIYADINPLINRIELDRQKQAVKFHDKNISLDFGGYGKGYALNSIGKLLDDFKIQNAFVSFGGSSVLTRGHHPHGKYWPLALQDNTEKSWELTDAAVAISSNYLIKAGKQIEHIINPDQDRFNKVKKTVYVKAQNAIDAEVLSTALIAAPVTEYNKISSAFPGTIFHFVVKTN